MPVNSRAKGAKGERDAIKFLTFVWKLREHLLRRNVREQARAGSVVVGDQQVSMSDLLGIKGVHIEVKRYGSKIRLANWIRKAESNALPGDVVVIVWRVDGDTEWNMWVRARQLLLLVQRIQATKGVPLYPEERAA